MRTLLLLFVLQPVLPVDGASTACTSVTVYVPMSAVIRSTENVIAVARTAGPVAIVKV